MEIFSVVAGIDIGVGKVDFAGEEAVGRAEPALARGTAVTVGDGDPLGEQLLPERLGAERCPAAEVFAVLRGRRGCGSGDRHRIDRLRRSCGIERGGVGDSGGARGGQHDRRPRRAGGLGCFAFSG